MAVIGYRYFFDLLMGIGKSADELVEIKVGDKTAWRGSVTSNSQITIDQPNLFGGEKLEGGVQGTLDVLFGGPSQVAPAGAVSTFGSPQPGRRGKFTAFYSGLVCMNNPYPKKWSMRHRRITSDWDGGVWYPERATINLVRPTSESEIGAGAASTTETLQLNETFPRKFTGETAVLQTNGTVLSVDIVEVLLFNDNGAAPLTLGTHYSLSPDNKTITFLLDNPDCQYLSVYYTAEVEINGSGISGIGDTLIKAMNPAHVLYELMTNRVWGRGLPRATLGDTAWRAAADRLSAEGHGFCRRWARRDEIKVFAQSVLDQIGGVMFEDRTTGLIVLKLIRDDYTIDALPLYDMKSGLLEIDDAPVPASPSMINELRVKYRDPVTNEDRVVRLANLAARQSAGGFSNVQEKEYQGCPTAELASRLAKRDMRAAAPGLRRYSLVFDRRGSKLQPGGVVRIQDLPRNIPDQVLRIATIDYGTATDGKVKVTAVTDVFATPRKGFTVIGPPSWTPPNTRPCVGRHHVFELPYRSLYRSLSAADFNFIEPDAAYLGVVIERGTSLNVTTDLAVRAGAVETEDWPADDGYYCGYVPPP